MPPVTRAKLFAIAAGALIVALGVGYVWGASGRFDAEHALEQTRQQLDLAEARGELLDARVSLYNLNFGEAVTHFEAAKAPLQRAEQRYREWGDNAAAGSLATALERVAEGQQLAGKLDQAAGAKAVEAFQAIRAATKH